jgi:hypothetical protein
MYPFCNKASFYGEELLAPLPTPKLKDYPLPAVCDCLFNIFAATVHIGGCPFIRIQKTIHDMVRGTHLSWKKLSLFVNNGVGI